MFSKAQEVGWIVDFKVKEGGTIVNHLQFADNTIVFFDVNRDQVNYLRYILLCFGLMLGLRINFAKSSLFGISLQENLNTFASMLGCKQASWLTSYLGLLLDEKSFGKAKWEKLIEKCSNRLAYWKRKLLSKSGKLTLIKSVLSSFPIYLFLLFLAPCSITNKLDSIIRNFLWNKRGIRRITI